MERREEGEFESEERLRHPQMYTFTSVHNPKETEPAVCVFAAPSSYFSFQPSLMYVTGRK
jgi:hypothetical protein